MLLFFAGKKSKITKHLRLGASIFQSNNVLNTQNVPAIIIATVLRLARETITQLLWPATDLTITLCGKNNQGAVVMLIVF